MRSLSIFLPALFSFGFITGVIALGESSKVKEKSYLVDRLDESNCRYASFELITNLLSKRQSKILVELGTARNGDQNFRWDGGSTIIFANWAKDNQAKLYSVDYDIDAINRAKDATRNYSENVEFVHEDSLTFLDQFEEPIDFIYFDSSDYDIQNPESAQIHHFNELNLALPKLNEGSIIMIDDCDLAGGGRGKYTIDFLVQQGWRVVYRGYQVILVK